MPELQTIFLFGAVSLLGAALAVVVTGLLLGARAAAAPGRSGGPVFADAPQRYEFREGYLLSPIDPHDAFLPAATDRSAAFATLTDALRPLDAGLPAALAALSRRGESFLVTARFGQDDLAVAGRREGDRLVVTIGPTRTSGGRQVIETVALAALRDEVEELRDALDTTRAAIWRQDADGHVVWANRSYLALVDRLPDGAEAASRWPAPQLFADALSPLPEEGTVRRHKLPGPPGATGAADAADADDADPQGALWFEVGAERRADGGLLGTARPVDRLVAAESSLRSFVQTLSKTFAQLPIGLAVFDRRRELMLFNPALVTLSTLEPRFLSARPTLVAFLDALRDRQRMPEPRNYRDWRNAIALLEQDAEAGTYHDIWTLPGGQSFRVIGRPHPDGAIAFMFEDITSEVSLTRKFRGEIELYGHVLDDMPGALAVFGGDGRLVLANARYRARWGGDPQEAPGAPSLAEATDLWQSGCAPSRAWNRIRDFATPRAARAAWSDDVTTTAGEALLLHVAPLPGGALSVAFYPNAVAASGQAPASRATEMAEPAAPFRSRRATGP